MKTEPTEELKYRAKIYSWAIGETGDYDSCIGLVTPDFDLQCYDPDVDFEQVEELAKLLNKCTSNPKIKQLEWKENSNETRWYCDLPIGFYIIDTVRKYEAYRVRFYLSEYDYPKYERFCKTIEEAMMYAQSDFEARVKKCFTTE